jgi:hypothetical protein
MSGEKIMAFKNYIPIKSAVQAQAIAALTVTTVATLLDGSSVTVPNSAAEGDFIELNADQTTTWVPQATFLAQFVEEPGQA